MSKAHGRKRTKILDRIGPGDVHVEVIWEDGAQVGLRVSDTSSNAAGVLLSGRECQQLEKELAGTDRAWVKTDADPAGPMFRTFMCGASRDSDVTGRPSYEVWHRQPHGGFDLSLVVYEYGERDGSGRFFDLMPVEGQADMVLIGSAPDGSAFKADAVYPLPVVQQEILRLRQEGQLGVALHGEAGVIRPMETLLAVEPEPERAPVPRLAC